MPLTFRKRFKILPGLYLNVGKRSMSVTAKAGPFSVTRSTTGRTTRSADLPGPFGYRSSIRRRRSR